jgi:hypothetical protein
MMAQADQMKLPVIRGLIDRRILVNYRIDPQVIAGQLPAPFRPQIVGGYGMAGICLIRLKHVRPTFLPPWFGIASENAAHRVAVEWDQAGTVRQGVFVRRRDTSSWANSMAGGRVFPGVHHRAAFTVGETSDRFNVALRSDDGQTQVAVRGRLAADLPPGSIFGSTAEASAFFRAGSLGYSPDAAACCFQGLELRCRDWHVEPLAIDEVHSSYFDDRSLFPRGSIEFDCALLMRGIEHEWHAADDLCSAATERPRPCESAAAS